MLEIEVVQTQHGWEIRYRVDYREGGPLGWSEPTEIKDEDLGVALKALGDNAAQLIIEAQA